MTLGALGYVGYGQEVTEGTMVAPTIFLPVTSFGFEDSDDNIMPQRVMSTRDYTTALAAPYNVDGNMEMDLIPQGILALLESAFATSAVTVDGPDVGTNYQHTLTPGSAVPTMTFESNAADILVMRYGGIKVNTFELKAAYGEIVTATFGLVGTTRAKQASASAETYTATDEDPFHFTGAEISVGGSQLAYVKDFTFGVNNNIERIGTVRKTRNWKRMALGMREVSLGMTLDFTDDAEYDRFVAATYFDVEISLEGPTLGSVPMSLTITLPKVKWNKVGVPITASDYLEQSVEATILKPTGSAIFTGVLINDESNV